MKDHVKKTWYGLFKKKKLNIFATHRYKFVLLVLVET
jgi:hypothetical protein